MPLPSEKFQVGLPVCGSTAEMRGRVVLGRGANTAVVVIFPERFKLAVQTWGGSGKNANIGQTSTQIPSGQNTHPYRDINMLPSIAGVATPLYFASYEA